MGASLSRGLLSQVLSGGTSFAEAQKVPHPLSKGGDGFAKTAGDALTA
jgi:hypothetical protein